MATSLESLLRLGWVAATLPILLASVGFPSLRRLHSALSGVSGRGKTLLLPSSSSSVTRLTVPQRYFLHFYVLAVIWTTCLLICTWFCACGELKRSTSDPVEISTVASHLVGESHVSSIQKNKFSLAHYKKQVWTSVFLLLLMEAQLLRRLYESLFVFQYSSLARMHLLGYFTGLCFYSAAPLSLIGSSPREIWICMHSKIYELIFEGQAGMPTPKLLCWECVRPLTELGFSQGIGMAVFMWGWMHQLYCHAILGSLRRQRGSDEYMIPRGDWFEIVSCPHYLAEIVLYAGILIASGGSDITIWLLFMFVISNLVFAAAETHRWYHDKFEDYPGARYAILPYIY